MKRIKFMLLSLTLLAVVGGALAFKAKFGATPLCTTITLNAGPAPTCPILPGQFQLNPNVVSIYTTTPNQGTCSFIDQNQVIQPLTCFKSSRYSKD